MSYLTPTRLRRGVLTAAIASTAAAALVPSAGAAATTHQPPSWLNKVEAATSAAPILSSRAVPQVKGGAAAVSITSMKQKLSASWLGRQLVQGRVGNKWYVTAGKNCFTLHTTTFPTTQPVAYSIIPTSTNPSTPGEAVTYMRTSPTTGAWTIAKSAEHSAEHGTFTWDSHHRIISAKTAAYTTGHGKSRGHVDAEVTTITYPTVAPKSTPHSLPKCLKKS